MATMEGGGSSLQAVAQSTSSTFQAEDTASLEETIDIEGAPMKTHRGEGTRALETGGVVSMIQA